MRTTLAIWTHFFVDCDGVSDILVLYMKRKTVFWLAPCRVVGTLILAFCSFVPLSRASVIVDNTGGTSSVFPTFPLAQVFTMPSDTSGNVSALTLVLGSFTSGSAEVYIYATAGGSPANPYGAGQDLYDLGSVTAGSGVVTISDTSALLSSSSTYAIVMQPAGSSTWDYTTSSGNSGSGSLGGFFYFSGGIWNQNPSGNYLQMDLEVSPVPEMPITGVVIGFGALAIGMGHALRRKLVRLSSPSLTA